MESAMSYLALYRKWRPLVFDEVTEQEHVTVTLKNSVIAGRVSHAYLFCGTRGTGKTTVARIFARAINCTASEGGNPCNKCESCMDILSGRTVDVIEIDAASNNSVDNIRGVRDVVAYAPSISKYKVYIIDEVHMLSSGAFNALLKTLEEPPPHVVFFLATTEPHKLPATILSRCQRFDFKRITTEGIKNRLNEIAKADRALLDEDAARLIAILADGAMRDALSLLDQCMVSAGYDAAGPGSEFEATDQVASKQASGITAQTVRDVAGIADDKLISDMAEAALNRDISGITRLTDSILMQGAEISKFISNLIMYYRNMLVCRLTEDDSLIAGMTAESICRLKKQASLMGTEKIMQAIRKLSQTEPMLKWTNQPRIMLELAMIELCCEDEHPGSAGSAGAAGVTGVDGVTGAARAANAKASLDQQPAKTPAALEKASEDKHGEAEK
ncbi:MAG: DNA polymerase III subunit gamma/tau, partial [Eubacteriales bacterium]|nr:DNA polymerase III subunit gamma/tau [Eubacteriales bacterium]